MYFYNYSSNVKIKSNDLKKLGHALVDLGLVESKAYLYEASLFLCDQNSQNRATLEMTDAQKAVVLKAAQNRLKALEK